MVFVIDIVSMFIIKVGNSPSIPNLLEILYVVVRISSNVFSVSTEMISPLFCWGDGLHVLVFKC